MHYTVCTICAIPNAAVMFCSILQSTDGILVLPDIALILHFYFAIYWATYTSNILVEYQVPGPKNQNQNHCKPELAKTLNIKWHVDQTGKIWQINKETRQVYIQIGKLIEMKNRCECRETDNETLVSERLQKATRTRTMKTEAGNRKKLSTECDRTWCPRILVGIFKKKVCDKEGV